MPENVYQFPSAERQMPMSSDAERGVIGACVINPALYEIAAARLQPQHFGFPVHGRIFNAIGTLLRGGKPVDVVLIKDVLGEEEILSGHGGAAQYVKTLIPDAVAGAFLPSYVDIILNAFQRRAGIQSCNDFMAAAGNPTGDLADAFSRLQAEIRQTAESSAPSALWVDDGSWKEEDIPVRAWVAPGFALRGGVTILSGPPSAMKSSLMLAWACSVALGRPHSDFRPRKPGKVAVYNCEDDGDEQRRRLSATLRQFGACPDDIRGKVIRTGPLRIGTLFVVDSQTGTIIESPALAVLRVLLREYTPDMLIVDPLAELHTAMENDNTAMRAVVSSFRELAKEFNVAVVILHHTRKGSVTPGDIDASRGASATIGATRVALTLTTMSKEDAEALGIDTDRETREGYIRLDDARQSYAAISEARWFQKAVYTLANREQVAAAVPWTPPKTWDGLRNSDLNRALDDIEAGMEDGRRYSAGGRAKENAAWTIVQKYSPDKTEKQCREIVRTWIENGVLYAEEYVNPLRGEKQMGLRVNQGKRPS
jgi:replicative DNA helicase